MHPEKEEKVSERPVNSITGRRIQKITDSSAYANTIRGKEIIHTKKPVRKEETLYINDDEHLKNQMTR